ncbi:MAG: rod shape-determining protein MreD [Candidatus Omnitrophica bacterium]|nr:rod shape-determining protein MreD [Candidatus Omnitrophota bacterium]
MYRVNRMLVYFTLFLFLIIESTVINRISIKDATPALLVIFVIFFGFFYGMRIGLEVGLASGLLKDILGIGVFGINIFIFGTLGFICGALSDKVYKENFLTQFVFSFVAAFFISKLYLAHAVYTALVAPFAILALRFMFGKHI